MPFPVGVSILKRTDYAVKFEMDTRRTNMHSVLNWLGPERIADINISNVPLEEIIAGIYKTGQPELDPPANSSGTGHPTDSPPASAAGTLS
jgi:hypothetical protein